MCTFLHLLVSIIILCKSCIQTSTNRRRDVWADCDSLYNIMSSQYSQEKEIYDAMHYIGPRLHLPDNPKVLSIGSGFSWASEFALRHPNASVLSVDLKCLIRTLPIVDTHQVHTINDLPLDTLPPRYFDFVRLDKLSGRIGWAEFLLKIYQLMKPGAYLVLCDPSKKFWVMKGNSGWTTASAWFDSFGSKLGVNYNMLASSEVENTLTNTGFRYITRASSALSFGTEQGSQYASAIVEELGMIFWSMPPEDAVLYSWNSIARQLMEERHQVGVNL